METDVLIPKMMREKAKELCTEKVEGVFVCVSHWWSTYFPTHKFNSEINKTSIEMQDHRQASLVFAYGFTCNIYTRH